MMKTYKWTNGISEAEQTFAVINLRRAGFTAWAEADELHTDASAFQLGMCLGNSARYIQL